MSKRTWFCVEIGQRFTTVFTTSDISDVKILPARGQGRNDQSIMCFTEEGRKFQMYATSVTEPYFDTTVSNIIGAIGKNEVLIKYKGIDYYPEDILSYYLNFITSIPDTGKRYENVLFVEPNAWRNDKNREKCVEAAAKIVGIKQLEFISKGKAVAYCMYNRVYYSLKGHDTKYAYVIDAGESSIEASVYKFTEKEIEQVLCWTIDFGGENVTNAAANHLLNKFTKEARDRNIKNFFENIRSNPSSQKGCIFLSCTRKTKEAVAGLSSYTKFPSDALSSDLDLNLKASGRDINDNEEMRFYAPKLERFFKAINDEVSKMRIKLELCELRGGNSHVPFLRKIVEKCLKQKLTMLLNCTEIFAEGAAFYKKAQISDIPNPVYKESKEVKNFTIKLPKSNDISYKLVFTKKEISTKDRRIRVNERQYKLLQEQDDKIEANSALLNDAMILVRIIDSMTKDLNQKMSNFIDLNVKNSMKQELNAVLGDYGDAVDMKKLKAVYDKCSSNFQNFFHNKTLEDQRIHVPNKEILKSALCFKTQLFKAFPKIKIHEIETFGEAYTEELNKAKEEEYRKKSIKTNDIIKKKQYGPK